jgi:hypothetical protein
LAVDQVGAAARPSAWLAQNRPSAESNLAALDALWLAEYVQEEE